MYTVKSFDSLCFVQENNSLDCGPEVPFTSRLRVGCRRLEARPLETGIHLHRQLHGAGGGDQGTIRIPHGMITGALRMPWSK